MLNFREQKSRVFFLKKDVFGLMTARLMMYFSPSVCERPMFHLPKHGLLTLKTRSFEW